ncbi:MAG TPA: hypothetical protein VJC12_01840 [Candidatus Paceibacterota bacterium]
MARSVSEMVSPVVRGEDARRILKEIQEGTPNTPERLETIRRADEVFRKMSGKLPFACVK